MDASQIAIATNEISRDPLTALELGNGWGIRNYELHDILSFRVPRLPEADLRRLEDAVRAYEAKIVSITPGLFINTVWGTPEAEEHRRELFPRSLEFAHRFGASIVIVFSCCRPESARPDDPCPEPVIQELRRLAGIAQGEGITLMLENLRPTWANTSTQMVDILARVDHPNLQANWDPVNAYVAGETRPHPAGDERLAGRIGYLHLKDIRRDAGSPRGWQVTPLLEGEIGWEGLLQALAQRGYDGYLVIETHCAPFVQNSHTNLERLRGMLTKLIP